MTPQEFTYWLQGFMETADPKTIDERQTQVIKDHLKLVFTKVTPHSPAPNLSQPFEPNLFPGVINPYEMTCKDNNFC